MTNYESTYILLNQQKKRFLAQFKIEDAATPPIINVKALELFEASKVFSINTITGAKKDDATAVIYVSDDKNKIIPVEGSFTSLTKQEPLPFAIDPTTSTIIKTQAITKTVNLIKDLPKKAINTLIDSIPKKSLPAGLPLDEIKTLLNDSSKLTEDDIKKLIEKLPQNIKSKLPDATTIKTLLQNPDALPYLLMPMGIQVVFSFSLIFALIATTDKNTKLTKTELFVLMHEKEKNKSYQAKFPLPLTLFNLTGLSLDGTYLSVVGTDDKGTTGKVFFFNILEFLDNDVLLSFYNNPSSETLQKAVTERSLRNSRFINFPSKVSIACFTSFGEALYAVGSSEAGFELFVTNLEIVVGETERKIDYRTTIKTSPEEAPVDIVCNATSGCIAFRSNAGGYFLVFNKIERAELYAVKKKGLYIEKITVSTPPSALAISDKNIYATTFYTNKLALQQIPTVALNAPLDLTKALEEGKTQIKPVPTKPLTMVVNTDPPFSQTLPFIVAFSQKT